MADNPFQSPVATDGQPETTTSHSIILAWERMRFFYNIILGAAGLVGLVAYCRIYPANIVESIIGSIMFGVFANICFLAGPLAEFYLSFFKKRVEVPESRLIFFLIGTAVSLIPIAVVLLSALFGP